MAVADSGALGQARVCVDIYDDTVERIPVQKIARLNRGDTRVVVGLVGVQSNQFARAADLALEFRRAGVQVMIGGFHVSGMLALFDSPSHELQALLDQGVSLVRGEAEAPGAMETILRDALAGAMKPIYNIVDLPDLEHAPVPRVSRKLRYRYLLQDKATVDTSRGCPFGCTFCAVINVQGRKMRYRSAASVLQAVEDNYRQGIREYFFTDDNFARNPVWEQILDGLIELRTTKGIQISFLLQTDTQAHRIPHFVSKAAAAGCHGAFIGMESVNPENLKAVGKAQNRVDDYAEMTSVWHKHGILVEVGYIIGLPEDTLESVRRDMVTLRDRIKVDVSTFFMLLPIPGSKDHVKMVSTCKGIDADLNNFDTVHETFRHAHMAPGEWRQAFEEAMLALYDKDCVVNAILRVPEHRRFDMFGLSFWYRSCAVKGLHPFLTGFWRLKDRRARRPIFPRESILRYTSRRVRDGLFEVKWYWDMVVDFQEIWLLTGRADDARTQAMAKLRDLWVEARLSSDADKTGDVLGKCTEILTGLMNECSDARVKEDISHILRETETRIGQSTRTCNENVQFIHDRIITQCENILFPSVARRRRANEFYKRAMQHVKAGRLHRINPFETMSALCTELFFLGGMALFVAGRR